MILAEQQDSLAGWFLSGEIYDRYPDILGLLLANQIYSHQWVSYPVASVTLDPNCNPIICKQTLGYL